MNRLKSVLFVSVLAMMGLTAAVLAHAKSNQRLGAPGVKTVPLPGSSNLEVVLPDTLPDYQSRKLPQAEVVTNALPSDTSFGQRLYQANDGFQALANVVLMGTTRTSIHKPQICLTAQGWNISETDSRVETVRVEKPAPYDLPVMRLSASRQANVDGRIVTEKGLYVYWFVDADRYTASHSSRILWMTSDMIFKNQLDRWAYISFFSVCAPGQEDAAFDRIKKLIAAAVPEFQLVPRAAK